METQDFSAREGPFPRLGAQPFSPSLLTGAKEAPT
jgi:hypothetical protein